MKFEIIEDDGVGVRALLAAAETLNELTEERNIALGVLEGDAVGEDGNVGVVMAKRTTGTQASYLAVTIERNPRLIRVSRD